MNKFKCSWASSEDNIVWYVVLTVLSYLIKDTACAVSWGGMVSITCILQTPTYSCAKFIKKAVWLSYMLALHLGEKYLLFTIYRPADALVCGSSGILLCVCAQSKLVCVVSLVSAVCVLLNMCRPLGTSVTQLNLSQ